MKQEERAKLGDLPSAQLQCLFVLRLAHTNGVDWLAPNVIATALQHLGIAVSGVAARNTLDAAARMRPGLVSRRASRTRSYRLAQPGERALEAALGGNVAVVRIDAGKPHTARAQLGQIFGGLTGIVRISDPYFGARSADALAASAPAKEVRALLGKVGGGEDAARARRALVDVTVEHPNVHVRLAPPAQLAHDRFVLTDDEMIIVGHGLKDIGGRDSFVIRLPRDLVQDSATRTEQAFDALWNASAPVTP